MSSKYFREMDAKNYFHQECLTRQQTMDFITMDTRRIKKSLNDPLDDRRTEGRAVVVVESCRMEMDVSFANFKKTYNELILEIQKEVQKVKDADPNLFVLDVVAIFVTEERAGSTFHFKVYLSL